MVKQPTGSGGEPSSPNCGASAGVKVRHPSFFRAHVGAAFQPIRHELSLICVTQLCHLVQSNQRDNMASITGLFRRNGHFYLRVLLPLQHPLRLSGKSRIVKSLGTYLQGRSQSSRFKATQVSGVSKAPTLRKKFPYTQSLMSLVF